MDRKLSRKLVRFLIRASVSSTVVVLSSLSVACCTIWPCFSTCSKSFFTSPGETRSAMLPDGAASPVFVTRLEETTVHSIVPQ